MNLGEAGVVSTQHKEAFISTYSRMKVYTLTTLVQFDTEIHLIFLALFCFKGPCSPKRLFALVLLFWKGSFVECSFLIGCYFNYAKFPQCIMGDNRPLIVKSGTEVSQFSSYSKSQ